MRHVAYRVRCSAIKSRIYHVLEQVYLSAIHRDPVEWINYGIRSAYFTSRCIGTASPPVSHISAVASGYRCAARNRETARSTISLFDIGDSGKGLTAGAASPRCRLLGDPFAPPRRRRGGPRTAGEASEASKRQRRSRRIHKRNSGATTNSADTAAAVVR